MQQSPVGTTAAQRPHQPRADFGPGHMKDAAVPSQQHVSAHRHASESRRHDGVHPADTSSSITSCDVDDYAPTRRMRKSQKVLVTTAKPPSEDTTGTTPCSNIQALGRDSSHTSDASQLPSVGSAGDVHGFIHEPSHDAEITRRPRISASLNDKEAEAAMEEFKRYNSTMPTSVRTTNNDAPAMWNSGDGESDANGRVESAESFPQGGSGRCSVPAMHDDGKQRLERNGPGTDDNGNGGLRRCLWWR